MNPNFEIESTYMASYLNLISHAMKSMRIPQAIDQLVPYDPQCNVSPGKMVQNSPRQKSIVQPIHRHNGCLRCKKKDYLSAVSMAFGQSHTSLLRYLKSDALVHVKLHSDKSVAFTLLKKAVESHTFKPKYPS